MNTVDDNTVDAGRRMMTATENTVADNLAATPTASKLPPSARHGNAATLGPIAEAAERARP